jgi:hypothetical protein
MPDDTGWADEAAERASEAARTIHEQRYEGFKAEARLGDVKESIRVRHAGSTRGTQMEAELLKAGFSTRHPFGPARTYQGGSL